MTKTIKENSQWIANDSKQFEVIKVDGDWVFYKNINTGQSYSCLAGAFSQRFSEVVNNG
jgi:peroxiredoxin